MTDMERCELINAARSYERIVADRRALFLRTDDLMRDGFCEEAVKLRQEVLASRESVRHAERLLASRIYGPHDVIRVDGVIYIPYSMETLLRVPIEDVPDLAADPAVVLDMDGKACELA